MCETSGNGISFHISLTCETCAITHIKLTISESILIDFDDGVCVCVRAICNQIYHKLNVCECKSSTFQFANGA